MLVSRGLLDLLERLGHATDKMLVGYATGTDVLLKGSKMACNRCGCGSGKTTKRAAKPKTAGRSKTKAKKK